MSTLTERPDKKASAKNRQKAFHSAKDYEQSASQIGDIVPADDTVKGKARRVAAEQLVRREPEATSEDLAELLMMLGLHPSQPDWTDTPTAMLRGGAR